MSQPTVSKAVRRLLLLCALLAALCAPAPARARVSTFVPAQAEVDPAIAAALDQFLDQAAADSGAPGVVLAVAIPGQAVWAGARGLADRDQGLPLAPDAHFGVASITKMFVATVAMQLVQEGWLSLDQTVEHWLPGLVPHGDRIAVRHLLSHTSGLRDYLDEPFMRAVLADRGRDWAPWELVAAATSRQPYFAAGAPGRWHYSNTNYVLLGLIIEQVTRNPLAREVHQRIIDPLGLRHTFFEPEDPVAGAVMHAYEGQRDLAPGLNMSFAWGAGNITSNADDLARFGQALFGGALLRPETLAAMQTFVGVDGAWGARDLTYGLGVMQSVLHAARPAVAHGHTGALAGYRTALWHLPDRGITLVAALNQMGANPTALATRALDVLQAHGVG